MKLTRKKKGATSIYFLWFLSFWFIIFLIFLNMAIQLGVYQRVNIAAQEAAQARALAIDVPKKESTGEIWIMNEGSTAFITGKQTEYNNASKSADAYALQAARNYIETFAGKNDKDEEIISNIKICFDYKPLPESSAENITFSCTIDGEVVSDTFRVTPVTENSNGPIKVKNAVFVAMKVNQNNVFTLSNFIPNTGNKTYTATALAYPQIDSCVRGTDGCSF